MCRAQSRRANLIDACLAVIREELRAKYNNKCQICGSDRNTGVFHILPRGIYPKMSLHRQNLLLVCWLPCHHYWHHHRTDSPQGKKVLAGIIKLRGKNYEMELKALDKIQPKYTENYLEFYLAALKQQNTVI
jgi:hypothetical protein